MNALTKTSSKSAGCGCGGGCGGACACPDTCGATGEGFVRPRFFAGQLLTEEDLGALIDYVVGKNRLHNRMLFGDGVVCGLTVTCDPCGGREVKVAPGYAIDCCGNDIYVPCAETVDIGQLLRELRLRQLDGYDCGDPCEDKGKETDERTYCLWMRYGETMSDPVAPYVSDDPCSSVDCEPTRIIEGYSFELRCENGDKDTPDLFDAILACVGDLRSAVATITRAQTREAQAFSLKHASTAVLSDQPFAFDAADGRALVRSFDAIEPLAVNVGDSDENGEAVEEAVVTAAARRGDDQDTGGSKVDEADFRRLVGEYQVAATTMARFRMLTPEEQEKAAAADERVAAAIKAAPGRLGRAGGRILKLAPELLSDAISREAAVDLVRLSERYAVNQADAVVLAQPKAMLFARGVAVSEAQLSGIRQDAQRLKAWLLDKFDGSCSLTSCDLRDRLCRIRLGDDSAALDAAATKALADAVVELVFILLEYFKDCICLALNPSCERCDDTAVRLACLTVKDCEVVDICNLSRRFVLSPTAIRYWLPPLKAIGGLFEQFCCDFEFRPPKDQQDGGNLGRVELDAGETPFVRGAQFQGSVADVGPAAVIATNLAGYTVKQVDTAATLGASLAILASRAEPPTALRLAAAEAEASGLSFLLPRRPSTEKPGEAGELSTVELEALRSEMARNLSLVREGAIRARADIEAVRTRAEAAEAAVSAVDPDTLRASMLDSVRSEVESAITPARLRSAVANAKAVKDLQAENEALKSAVAELAEKVIALER